MQQPPLLPEQILARTLRVAAIDGGSVLLVASLFAILAAAGGQAAIASFGLAGAAAGAIELHGASLLRHGYQRGMRFLIGSQPLLLLTILGYCAWRLQHVEIPPIPEWARDSLQLSADQLQLSVDDYLRLVYRLTYWGLAFVSVLFQGGMTLYYLRRRKAVSLALPEDET